MTTMPSIHIALLFVTYVVLIVLTTCSSLLHVGDAIVPPPTALTFCSMVDYDVSRTITDLQAADKQARAIFDQYKPSQLQTQDCLDSYKRYICAKQFPRDPWCYEENVICRDGCVELTANCAQFPQDTLYRCFSSGLFYNTTECTPMGGEHRQQQQQQLRPSSTPEVPESSYAISAAKKNKKQQKHVIETNNNKRNNNNNDYLGISSNSSYFQCLQPPHGALHFCDPVVDYAIPSAQHDYRTVWYKMDNITATRFKIYAGRITDDLCHDALQAYLCQLAFVPCDVIDVDNDQSNLIDAYLRPQCEDTVGQWCPSYLTSKLCAFDEPQEPDASKCAATTTTTTTTATERKRSRFMTTD